MPAVNIKTLTGSQILIKTLKNLGIDTIFGYPGGVVLKVYDELSKESEIKHYLMRHEQGAVHAAEGYARVSDKCGVVLVTSGPGATNTISGIANAYLDGYPLLVISGQVCTDLIGKNSFQEVNFVDMVKSCTKKVYQINKIADLEKTIMEAYNTAISGKKGPVVVDIPKNIFVENSEFHNLNYINSEKEPKREFHIEKIINELKSAKRPLILSGGGVLHSNSSAELFTLVKSLNIPVVCTMMGIGTFPQDDENYLGMIGLYGANSANEAFAKSDLVLALGSRFNDRITSFFKPEELADKKIIQVDINRHEFSKNINTFLSVEADLKSFLTEFTRCKVSACAGLSSLKYSIPNPKKVSENLHSFEIMQVINEYMKTFNPVVTTEVGQHQLVALKTLTFNQPRKLLTPGGLGIMGFGFPAAIGASVAQKCAPVICISGDGSIQMNIQELAVCVDYRLPVKVFIINNGYLGLVRQTQEAQFGARYFETKLVNPDFVKLAESYGAKGFRVSKKEEIMPAIEKAFAESGPVFVDFITEPMENI